MASPGKGFPVTDSPGERETGTTPDQQVNRFAHSIGENARCLQEMHWRTLFGSL